MILSGEGDRHRRKQPHWVDHEQGQKPTEETGTEALKAYMFLPYKADRETKYLFWYFDPRNNNRKIHPIYLIVIFMPYQST